MRPLPTLKTTELPPLDLRLRSFAILVDRDTADFDLPTVGLDVLSSSIVLESFVNEENIRKKRAAKVSHGIGSKGKRVFFVFHARENNKGKDETSLLKAPVEQRIQLALAIPLQDQ